MSDLATIFRAVEIRSPHDYMLGGVSFRVPAYSPAPFGGQFSPFAAGVPPLVGDLQQRLYEHAYMRELTGRIEESQPQSIEDYMDVLSAANATRERWDSGWTITQFAHGGAIWAKKGDVVQSFAPGRYAGMQGAAPSVGAPVNVYLAKESRELQPGFYHMFGELPFDDRTPGLARIYFHIDEAGAPLLVNAVTSTLNRFLVPFRMKTLSYRGVYVRSDAAVLFFPKRHFPIIARLVAGRIRDAVRAHLRPRVPLMTKRLFDGVALAEDPGNGDSFGTNRCRLIAQAIWDAYARGQQSEEARMQELDMQFTRNGLALARPYLRAASADVYEIPMEIAA
ncbi:MAG TPA: T3SS effector HopA1 family protein [Thermoanaerobaculia bacterium]|nr:T3SS effector HopA1 family protein [Thermoanaerobaculia bacterium]